MSAWDTFGVAREGQRRISPTEKIADLLRFSTTRDDDASQRVSLKDYVAAMKEAAVDLLRGGRESRDSQEQPSY